MRRNKKSGPSRELIQAYRYEIVLEALQIILTDAGWFKDDLADYLEVKYEYINDLLTYRHCPVDPRLVRRIRQLYQRKYGHRRWCYIAQYIKRFRLSRLNKRNKHDDYDR